MSSHETPADHRLRDERVVIRLPENDLSIQLSGSPVAGRTVLVVASEYAPDPFGNAPCTTGVAEHLAATARRVDVITGVSGGLRGHRSTAQTLDGVPHLHPVRRRTDPVSPQAGHALHEGAFLTRALRTRLAHRPDLVVGVTPGIGAGAAAVKLARRYRAPLLTVVGGLVAPAGTPSTVGGAAVLRRMEAFALRGADGVAILSEAFRPEVTAYGVPDEKVHLLPSWTHVTPVPTPQADARARLGWKVGGFKVVHTGSMGPRQNLANVVEAARLLADRDDITFYLVGDGIDRRALLQRAQGLPNVRFVESLNPQDLSLALAAADVLLINERPVAGEMSLPSKLSSYLSAGRPVLAAVWPGGATGRELDRAQGAALQVDPGYPVKLAGAVLALEAEPSRRSAMGSAARAYAEARLGRERSMSTLDVLLRRVSAATGSGDTA